MPEHAPLKITIVTVTYQAAATLERTLKSVEGQTYAHIEHIIKDGGSNDDTLALAKAYKERNPQGNIFIFSEPDTGLYDAMNAALRLATGHYVCFLNAGDTLHAHDTIEQLVSKVDKMKKPAVLYGDTHIVDGQGRFLYQRKKRPPENLTSRSFADGMLICHQAFYARRDMVPPYDTRYRYSADFDWCVRVIKEGERMGLPFVNTHIVLADYLKEGMTTRHHKASLWERFRIMTHHYGLLTTLWKHIRFLFE